jgi:hypothetical protein
MILEFRVHLVAAHDRAQCSGADSDVILPHRSPLVHGVEGRDATDVSSGQAQDLSTHLNASRGHPALDALHQMQHRQQRRTGLRIPRRNRSQLLPRCLSDLCLGDAVVQARLIEVGDKVPVPHQLLRRHIPTGVPIRRRRQRLDELTHSLPLSPSCAARRPTTPS